MIRKKNTFLIGKRGLVLKKYTNPTIIIYDDNLHINENNDKG